MEALTHCQRCCYLWIAVCRQLADLKGGCPMKKRTLISMLRERSALRKELAAGDLELVLGGIKTITQDENGKPIVVTGDPPEV